MRIRAVVLACLVAMLGLLLAGRARADYAPIDRPGPPLSVPTAKLQSALSCSAGVNGATREPVLLVPGTTLNPHSDFSYGWEPALRARGWPYCTVDLPGNGMGDIQIAGEYVVYAIRAMHATSGQRVQIVGHSQGGMVPRWALRFWPDTRPMVDDVVGLSPSNHGTLDANVVCLLTCAPSIWQQRTNSPFIAALNSIQETFPGISYTDIYTDSDEVVVPNFGPAASSSRHGGGGEITNVPI
ncbi:MAG TPA: alpha/beta fold hydrolase, partial [Solirubrobacteraceae bacterium]